MLNPIDPIDLIDPIEIWLKSNWCPIEIQFAVVHLVCLSLTSRKLDLSCADMFAQLLLLFNDKNICSTVTGTAFAWLYLWHAQKIKSLIGRLSSAGFRLLKIDNFTNAAIFRRAPVLNAGQHSLQCLCHVWAASRLLNTFQCKQLTRKQTAVRVNST